MFSFKLRPITCNRSYHLLWYSQVKEGVSAPGGYVWLPHAMGRVINIVGLWPYGQHFCIGTILLSTDCKCEEEKKQLEYHFYQASGWENTKIRFFNIFLFLF